MKIKKPVVGDVVIYDDNVAFITRVYDKPYGPVELAVMVSEFNDHFWVTVFEREDFVPYGKWKYPEQTDEMIEVDDGQCEI